MKNLASILCDGGEKKDFRRNIYLHNGRLICDKNDITPMPGKYPRTQEGTNKALDDIEAMYSSGVWGLEFKENKKMKLTKIKKELEKLGYTFNSHKITKINSGRDENSMPILRDCEVLWVKTGAGDVAVICDLDGSNLHIFSHNGWAYLETTHDSIIKAFGSMPASAEESNRRKRELWGKITSSTAAAALGRIKSPKKTASSRENGKKGGRPKIEKVGE